MRLSLYVRVSTDEQARGGSMLEQEHRLRMWCDAMGHTVVSVYEDPGVSGSTNPHERKLGEAIKDCESHRADGVAVVSLDRLSRSLKHTLDLVDWAVAGGHALISLRESLDTHSPAGRMIVAVLAAMHQFTRESIVEKTRGAIDHLKKQGKVYGAIPWGKARGPSGRLVPCLEEVAATENLRTMLDENPGASAKKIAEMMNLHHGPQPRKQSGWNREDVNRLKAIMGYEPKDTPLFDGLEKDPATMNDRERGLALLDVAREAFGRDGEQRPEGLDTIPAPTTTQE